MPRFKKSKVFPGYIRVRNVNRNELTRLVQEAMGPDRTQGKFSEELGVDPSTLSRLLTKNYHEAPREELIEKIAENAAPQSGVTLEQLLDAYGYGKESDYKQYNRQDSSDVPEGQELNFLVHDLEFYPMLQSIIGELVLSGSYNVQQAKSKFPSPLQYGNHLRLLVYDFYTDALSDLGIRQWSFYLVAWCNDAAEAMMPIFQEAYSSICRKNEARKAYSLVTYDRELFAELTLEYKNMVVPDYISILLMDQEHGNTLCECILQQENPKHEKYVFTSLAPVQDDEEPEDQGDVPISELLTGLSKHVQPLEGIESQEKYQSYEVSHHDRLEKVRQKRAGDPDDDE